MAHIREVELMIDFLFNHHVCLRQFKEDPVTRCSQNVRLGYTPDVHTNTDLLFTTLFLNCLKIIICA